MISIIIPSYNREKTIGRALESVLAQTYQDWEVIVMDDGSRDQTEAVIAGYSRDQRIRYFKQANAGPVVARNNAVKYAQGELLAFLDSDDEWLPEKLEKQLAVLSQHNKPVLVIGNYIYVNEKNEQLGEFYGVKTVPHSGFVLKYLLADNFVLTSSVLMPRALFLEQGGFDEKLNLIIGEDHEFWLRLAGNIEFYYVVEPVVLYRVHSVQLTKQKIKIYTSISKLYWHIFTNTKKYRQLSKTMVLFGLCQRVGRILKSSAG
jgi:glycosyltransferase involved in cell wall biosynthesis